MAIRFSCPTCSSAYTVAERDAGKKITCKCGQSLRVPTPRRSQTILGEALPLVPDTNSAPSSDSLLLLPEAQLLDSQATSNEANTRASQTQDESASVGYLPPLPKSSRVPRFVQFGAVILVALLGVGAISILLLKLLVGLEQDQKQAASAEANNDLLRWAPKNTEVVIGMNFKELNSNPELAKLLAPKLTAVLNLGIKAEAIDAVFVFSPSIEDHANEGAVAFRLSHTFNPNIPIKAGQAKPRKHNKKEYLELTNGTKVYNPSAPIVVCYPNEDRFFEILDAEPTKPALSAEMVEAMREAKGPFLIALVGPAAQPSTRWLRPIQNAGPELSGEPHPLRLSATLSSRILPEHTEFSIVYTYSSREKARLAAEQVKAWEKRAMAQAEADNAPDGLGLYLRRVVYDTKKIDVSGSTVVVTCQLPQKELKRARDHNK